MVKKYCHLLAVATIAASLALAAGCSQKTVSTSGMESTSAADTGQQEQAQAPAPPLGSEESLESAAPARESSFTILEGRSTGPMLPVYFDFDKSNIRADQKGRIQKNARYLKDKPAAKIIIEGNTDERGTNEYNMALGERRALSAKKYLVNLGVAAGRISTISYGEEKPLNRGHDELAWSQNRRADFVEVR